jgi:amino acid transporter
LFIKKENPELNNFSFTTPGIIFSLLLIILVGLSFLSFKGSATILALTDFLLFLITGLIGVLLVFMWTGTDHQICGNNYNLLWAIPTHLFAAFFIRKQSPFAKKYFRFTAILSTLLLVCWYFLPQELNPAFIPIVILLGWRSWRIAQGKK